MKPGLSSRPWGAPPSGPLSIHVLLYYKLGLGVNRRFCSCKTALQST
ncbi:hypothetical protein ANACOL_03507 [Anaerotruncus colihominis DSM 17241]|uniref:Uncharacterized protein n=1 Tax=Anaerotruncus colihominis DSM 17241 TaxID=445972 RepID=B0PFC7_9FIRM|nr:hypothetical protein ANACOL_03507 [Anaerotruncus colihominis DSM 17241]